MFVDDDDFYNDDDEIDEREYKKKYRDDKDDYTFGDYSNTHNSQLVGSVIGVAKEFIDETTKEVVNNKIREVVDDMVGSIDTKKLGKSLIVGSVAGVLLTIALYKIFK